MSTSPDCDEKSSSMLGLHYEQCKAYDIVILSSTIKCDLVKLVVKNIAPLERWKIGLLAMLEKYPGICTVTKIMCIIIVRSIFQCSS